MMLMATTQARETLEGGMLAGLLGREYGVRLTRSLGKRMLLLGRR